MNAWAGTDTPDTGGGRDAAEGWSVQVRRDENAFASLETEWNQLYARCETATPFQSHAWVESWWRCYGTRGRLRLVLVRVEGRLVAVAPLALERRGPAAVLVPIGRGLSDFADLLVDDGTPGALRVFAQALVADPGWDILDLPETRPDAVAQRLTKGWPGGCWQLPDSTCLELPGVPLAELLTTLSNRVAQRVRAKLRKIEAQGISVRAVGPESVAEAVPAMLRLHQAQWQDRGGNPEHLRPRYARHLRRAVPRMIAEGQAAIFEYRIGDELVASDLVVIGPRLVGGYLLGVDPGLRDQVDVTTLLLHQNLGLAHRLGRPVCSMLRGLEPYKMRWQPVPVVNQRLLLTRPGSRTGPVYAACVRGRARAVAAARERLPWLRAVRGRARKVRARMLRRAR